MRKETDFTTLAQNRDVEAVRQKTWVQSATPLVDAFNYYKSLNEDLGEICNNLEESISKRDYERSLTNNAHATIDKTIDTINTNKGFLHELRTHPLFQNQMMTHCALESAKSSEKATQALSSIETYQAIQTFQGFGRRH